MNKTNETQEHFAKAIEAARNRSRDAIMRALEREDFTFNADRLEKYAVETLIKERRAVVLNLLGLTDRWGKIEIDVDNRNEGFAYEMMSEHIKKGMQEWFNTKFLKAIEERNRSFGSAAFMKRAMEIYDRAFERELDQQIGSHAREQARRVSQQIMQDSAKAVALSMSTGS